MKLNAHRLKVAQLFLNRLKKPLSEVKSKEQVELSAYSDHLNQGYHLAVYLESGVSWGCSFSADSNSGRPDKLALHIGRGIAGDPFELKGHGLDTASRCPYPSAKFSLETTDHGLRMAAKVLVRDLRQFLGEKAEVT